jgi:hypothetical protein
MTMLYMRGWNDGAASRSMVGGFVDGDKREYEAGYAHGVESLRAADEASRKWSDPFARRTQKADDRDPCPECGGNGQNDRAYQETGRTLACGACGGSGKYRLW